ncbi:hypothetical protein, partial [Massilia oculi]|uniref:hypothetical protein n=1 Tax=Massilia oculi TaxID=945844 RepID=UPI001AAE9B36
RHPQSLHALGHAHDRSGDHAVNPSGVWGTTRSIDLCNKAILHWQSPALYPFRPPCSCTFRGMLAYAVIFPFRIPTAGEKLFLSLNFIEYLNCRSHSVSLKRNFKLLSNIPRH